MYWSRRQNVMSGVLSSIMANCLPFAVSSKCVRRISRTSDDLVDEDEEVGKNCCNQGRRFDKKITFQYPINRLIVDDQRTESGWICRNNRCDDVDENQCTSRINISRNMDLVDEQHPRPNYTEEIVTKRHFSYVQELPHPSKLRKVKATAKVSKGRQRDLAVEQHIQQLRHKQLVFPSKSPVHSSAIVEKAADLEVSTSDQRLAVRLPSHLDLPGAETAATSLEMNLKREKCREYWFVQKPTGDSQETLPDAGWRACSKSDEEDDEWLKERWKALPYEGKQHEE